MATFLLRITVYGFMALCLYSLFIWFPVSVYDNINCLDKGYDRHRTTIQLKSYCIRDFGTKIIRRK